MRCAVYTRKSCEEGLSQEFNSLDAQRIAGESYVQSQQAEGWQLMEKRYDDGGFSGGTLERPALKALLQDIENGEIDCIVVYKIDRLSRSLIDFAKLVEIFDKHKVTFVAVTQSFNTSTSMGRLMLHVLLSFAQYERELTSERIRDKFAASKKQGIWMGGTPPLGYDIGERKLIINPKEAELVRHMYKRFLVVRSVTLLMDELNAAGYRTKSWTSASGKTSGGHLFTKSTVRKALTLDVYRGKVRHKDNVYDGEHQAIVDEKLWSDVQALFQRKDKPVARTAQTPLLQELMRCSHCDAAMTFTYTKKLNRKYCYYKCNKYMRTKQCNSPHKILPASDIEAFVEKHVLDYLSKPVLCAQTLHKLKQADITEASALRSLQHIHNLWHTLFPVEKQHICRHLIKQVLVKAEGIEINLHSHALSNLLSHSGLPDV